jgi:hypothetical protein
MVLRSAPEALQAGFCSKGALLVNHTDCTVLMGGAMPTFWAQGLPQRRKIHCGWTIELRVFDRFVLGCASQLKPEFQRHWTQFVMVSFVNAMMQRAVDEAGADAGTT